jgi:DNA-binding XRE family transcriptional regulator
MTKQGGWPATGFGDRLKTLREEADISQQALADAAGCHRFTISKLERGEQEPAWPLVLAICEALDLDPTAFLPAGKSRRPRRKK